MEDENKKYQLVCPKCKSKRIEVELFTEEKVKTNYMKILYWIFIGWWLEPLMWLFLFPIRFFIFLFVPKSEKVVTETKTIKVCQNCGHTWK